MADGNFFTRLFSRFSKNSAEEENRVEQQIKEYNMQLGKEVETVFQNMDVSMKNDVLASALQKYFLSEQSQLKSNVEYLNSLEHEFENIIRKNYKKAFGNINSVKSYFHRTSTMSQASQELEEEISALDLFLNYYAAINRYNYAFNKIIDSSEYQEYKHKLETLTIQKICLKYPEFIFTKLDKQNQCKVIQLVNELEKKDVEPAEQDNSTDSERIKAEYETEPPGKRLEVTMTSDAFPSPEDAFAIWDNIRGEYYADTDGRVLTYPTKEEAKAGLLKVQKAIKVNAVFQNMGVPMKKDVLVASLANAYKNSIEIVKSGLNDEPEIVQQREGKRINQGYEIIESCTIGNIELVIGHHPKAPNPYVCWYCKGDDNYYQGHYCNTLGAAREELNKRYQSECHMPYNQQSDLNDETAPSEPELEPEPQPYSPEPETQPHQEEPEAFSAPTLETGIYDDRLFSDVIKGAAAAAREAGLPFSESYQEENFDPYVFDGSMSVEDYELMHRMMDIEV